MRKIKTMKTWTAAILACGMLLSGCGSDETVKDVKKSAPNQASATKTAEKQEESAPIPYLVVDKDYNVVGNNHFENVKSIDLSIDTRFHLGINYVSPSASDSWGDREHERTFKIAGKAFADCPNLRQVFVSSESRVTEVAEDAFEGCAEDLTVYCKKGSDL